MALSILTSMATALPTPPWTLRLALRWPCPCVVCGLWGLGPVCRLCWDAYAPPVRRCPCCALPLQGLTRQHPPTPALSSCRAAVAYDFPWAGLIGRLKFAQDLSTVSTGVALMVRALLLAPWVGPPPLVLPMPLSAPRWRERGYNPSELLGAGVARWLRWPYDPDLLTRPVHRSPQMQRHGRARRQHIQGVFAVSARATRVARGQPLLLVDDVGTTLSTAQEAARTLQAAGLGPVHLLVLARAV